MAKVFQPPDDLRQSIAFVAERKDRMSVSLRDGVAVTTARHSTLVISVQDLLISVAMMSLEPGEQRRSEVEADERIVDDIWRVTLGVNALVPIVKRRGAGLHIDFAGPWVLAWWLIKVAVDDECKRH